MRKPTLPPPAPAPRAWKIGIAFAALATPALTAALVTLDTRGFLQVPALTTSLGALAVPYVGLALLACAGGRAAGFFALALALPVLLATTAALIGGGERALGVCAYFAPVLGVPATFLLVAQIGLALGGLGVVRNARRSGHVFACTMGLALAVGVLGCVDNASRWLGSSERRATVALGRAIDAHEAMVRAHRCLRLHHRAHGRYPDTLAALGGTGNDCDTLSADGFTIAYSRRGDGFELRAVPDDPASRSTYGRVADESGALYAGIERHSGQEPLPGMVSEVITEIDLCLEQYRLAHPARGYPRSLATPDAEGFACFASSGLGERMRSVVAVGEAEGYGYHYAPGTPDAQGRVASFRLDVRPLAYGRAFRRSWLCTPEGSLHATDEDRAAERSDPDEQLDVVTGRSERTRCLGPDAPARLSMR